jgi:flagellar protein FlgJ
MPALLSTSAIDPGTWVAGQTVRTAATGHTAELTAATSAQTGSQAANKAREVGQQFEALYLRQMLEECMPKDSDDLFGQGTSGTMWRAMLIDSLATTLSKTGTIGLAQMVIKPPADPLEGK